MNTKRVQRFITGSGMGTLVSFVIIVTQYQESVSPRISLTTILIGMIVVGTLFETKVSKDFLSAPISYISGIGAVFLVAALSYWNKDIPAEAPFSWLWRFHHSRHTFSDHYHFWMLLFRVQSTSVVQ